jgi:hypothetical protein
MCGVQLGSSPVGLFMFSINNRNNTNTLLRWMELRLYPSHKSLLVLQYFRRRVVLVLACAGIILTMVFQAKERQVIKSVIPRVMIKVGYLALLFAAVVIKSEAKAAPATTRL